MTDQSKQLSGLQRLWFVLTMIWIVLAAAAVAPAIPTSAAAYDTARAEIDSKLRVFERSITPGAGEQMPATDYVNLSGMSGAPDREYVERVLSDRGAQLVQRLCAGKGGCSYPTQWLSSELVRIAAELDNRLTAIAAEQRALLLRLMLLCLAPPLGVYLLGWAIAYGLRRRSA